MAAKRIAFSYAATLVVGGLFLLTGRLSLAAEELLPAPAPAPLPGHATIKSQRAPAKPAAPVAEEPQAESFSSIEQEPLVDEGECENFCGMALCGPAGKYWLRADYLMWWTSGMRLPPLVTTSPAGTPVSDAGVLGLPNTRILYGDDTVTNDGRSGVRTALGMWLDRCQRWGLEFDYLTLGENDSGFNDVSTGNPILTRPFFNVQTGEQASELVAYPDIAVGSVSVDAKQYFQSLGATLSYRLCSCESCCPCDPCEETCCSASCAPTMRCCRTDLIAGFRYYNLIDSVTIHETPSLTDSVATHDLIASFDIHDNFRARNDFYGSDVGLRTRIYRGRWSFDILTKVAIGNTHQTININGTTNITANGSTSTYTTGILAGPDNSGAFQRDSFTVIPELTLEIGYQLNCHWQAHVGYDLLYWACVARAGEQIDLNVDPRNFPPTDPAVTGLPFPAFTGRSSAFWAQGVNAGLEYRF
ncbi:MAG: BBP7 family outer membrane beta-barrel protein [Planctomycetaceae bacterium]|nr:BBP7 family outer membrane beta-barrel protein [Planctomycetaceae bacterium]